MSDAVNKILKITSEYVSKLPSKEYDKIFAIIQHEKDKARKEGLKEGIWRYAWWKDGVQYVGTTGKTYADAIAEIEQS